MAFFDLDRFQGSKKAETDRREDIFVRALQGEIEDVRLDVARRDFLAIEGSPLAYRRVGLVSHIFRQQPTLSPSAGIATKGLATTADYIFVREFWEVPSGAEGSVPFAKGGGFSRFYSDVHLLILWKEEGKALYQYLDKNRGLSYSMD